ncbi:hypothetical protein FOZ63_007968 [Perkinsus olseni]|uniref:C3H1-type domain-containing protein n=1 Tax=Perkinsus olseni TaxID=32597 RepID=A0A7J6RNP6_PEROL|nr:hypothetical protein FOZ63_007968 [Perkinsus olseni]
MYRLVPSPFSSVSPAPTPSGVDSSPQLGSPLKSHPLHRYRSRFCVYNVTGGQGCLDGDRCPFAHSPYQLARPKSYLCPAKAGYCHGLGLCPFAHDEDELEKSPLPVIKRLCKYLSTSHGCNLGDGCRNAHSEEEVLSGVRLFASNRVDPNNDYVLSLYHGGPPKGVKNSLHSASSRPADNSSGLRIDPPDSRLRPGCNKELRLLLPPPPSTPQSFSSSDVTTPNASHATHFINKALFESVAASVVEDQLGYVAMGDIFSSLALLLDCELDSSILNIPLVGSRLKKDAYY